MTLEEHVFQKGKPEIEALLRFGFARTTAGYEYRESFLDDQFEAVVFIGEDGRVQGKVLDRENENEEYEALRVEGFHGGFIGAVREAYTDILKKIHRECFRAETFVSPQANRIERLLFQRYGDRPDFPFSDMENYGVFRVSSTNKWYALIMRVPYAKLQKSKGVPGEVDIVNLKIDEDKGSELFRLDGVIPAYHMNHRTWASIYLDDQVSDEFVLNLLAVSRDYASTGKKKKK